MGDPDDVIDKTLEPEKPFENEVGANATLHGNFQSFWVSVLRAEAPPEVLVSTDEYGAFGPFAVVLAYVDNTFRVTERKSSFYLEFVGGMTTFFAMCYIMALNGIIIGGQWPIGTGLSLNSVFFATTLTAGIFTFMMGLLVNVPVALAPGMGLNGYFATVASSCEANPNGALHGVECKGWGEATLPWSDAMGAVFISGLFYLFLTVTGLRSLLFRAISPSFRGAITVGIGFFITIIGLTIGNLTRVTVAPWAIAYHVIPAASCFIKPDGTIVACDKAVDLDFSFFSLGMVRYNYHATARIAVLGLVLAAGLTALKFKGAIITSIALATLVGINYGNVPCHSMTDSDCVTNLMRFSDPGPKYVVDITDIPSGRLTFKYANSSIFWEAVFTFLFVEMVDSFGTLSGLFQRCGFLDGDFELGMAKLNRAMCVDGCSLWLGGIIGANSCTTYVESTTGVEAGARTGVASMVTGSAFLLSLLFVFPFVAIIPDAATTCALVMVGVHCLQAIKEVDFDDFTEQLTAFFTIMTMGFTYSITNGICVGAVFSTWMHTLLYVVYTVKKMIWPVSDDKIPPIPHPIMYLLAIFAVLRFTYCGDFVIHGHAVAPENTSL